jgi:tetratricopeptide (TPR) repeat protein
MKQPLRCSRVLAVALVLAALAAPAGARADDNRHLADARQALAALKYEQALHALEKALYAGKNSSEDMKTIYRMLGEIHASLGHQDDAQRYFRSLLALEPTAELARGISPKIQQPFKAARDSMSARGKLDVRCSAGDAASGVTLDVVSDPVGMVAGARVVYRLEDGTEQTLESSGPGSHTVRVPVTEPVSLVCAAVDEHGNRLVEIGSWSDPLTLAPVARAESAATITEVRPAGKAPATPLYGRWYVWGTAAVLAGGAGGYFGWQVSQDQAALDRLNENSPDHSFSEADEIERRGKRNALITNIAFGAAGAFAIAAVVSLVLEPDAPVAESAGESAASLGPLPLEQGAGVSLSFTF